MDIRVFKGIGKTNDDLTETLNKKIVSIKTSGQDVGVCRHAFASSHNDRKNYNYISKLITPRTFRKSRCMEVRHKDLNKTHLSR